MTPSALLASSLIEHGSLIVLAAVTSFWRYFIYKAEPLLEILRIRDTAYRALVITQLCLNAMFVVALVHNLSPSQTHAVVIIISIMIVFLGEVACTHNQTGLTPHYTRQWVRSGREIYRALLLITMFVFSGILFWDLLPYGKYIVGE